MWKFPSLKKDDFDFLRTFFFILVSNVTIEKAPPLTNNAIILLPAQLTNDVWKNASVVEILQFHLQNNNAIASVTTNPSSEEQKCT